MTDEPFCDRNCQKIAKLKDIVNTRSHGKVEGTAVDLYTASAITSVYDTLSEANRQKFSALPVRRMASIAFKLLNK